MATKGTQTARMLEATLTAISKVNIEIAAGKAIIAALEKAKRLDDRSKETVIIMHENWCLRLGLLPVVIKNDRMFRKNMTKAVNSILDRLVETRTEQLHVLYQRNLNTNIRTLFDTVAQIRVCVKEIMANKTTASIVIAKRDEINRYLVNMGMTALRVKNVEALTDGQNARAYTARIAVEAGKVLTDLSSKLDRERQKLLTAALVM